MSNQTLIILLIFFLGLLFVFGLFFSFENGPINETETMEEKEIMLPDPQKSSQVSLEETLAGRRSVRDFKGESLTLAEVSQLLWAAQGVTSPPDKRTAPSAGATYPLEVYLVADKVEGLEAGLYRYLPEDHSLSLISGGAKGEALKDAAMGQGFVAEAPINIVFTAVYERTTGRYGDKGERYVHMEAGHAAQNIYLQCEALDLGTVVVGAFNDSQVKGILGLPENEDPLYIIPIGHK